MDMSLVTTTGRRRYIVSTVCDTKRDSKYPSAPHCKAKVPGYYGTVGNPFQQSRVPFRRIFLHPVPRPGFQSRAFPFGNFHAPVYLTLVSTLHSYQSKKSVQLYTSIPDPKESGCKHKHSTRILRQLRTPSLPYSSQLAASACAAIGFPIQVTPSLD